MCSSVLMGVLTGEHTLGSCHKTATQELRVSSAPLPQDRGETAWNKDLAHTSLPLL